MCSPGPAEEDAASAASPTTGGRFFRKSTLSDVTPHVLRHSFASIANDLGFTEVTIAALVGHAKGFRHQQVHSHPRTRR